MRACVSVWIFVGITWTKEQTSERPTPFFVQWTLSQNEICCLIKLALILFLFIFFIIVEYEHLGDWLYCERTTERLMCVLGFRRLVFHGVTFEMYENIKLISSGDLFIMLVNSSQCSSIYSGHSSTAMSTKHSFWLTQLLVWHS